MIPTWHLPAPPVTAVLLALGLCLGSFLNVVIHRLPLGLSLIRPRSRCPRCRTPIAPRDNVPVLSYLLLRGRCRSCRARISIRYPVVELLGAGCVWGAACASSSTAGSVIRAGFLLAMLAVTWIDFDYRIIPDIISLPGIALGLAVGPWIGTGRLDSLIGAAVGAGALLGAGTLYRWLRGVSGMGLGDVKLGGMLGAFLGWTGALLTILIGSFLGSIVGIALVLSRRGTGKTALPFGSFLAPAAAIVLLVGPALWDWYIRLVLIHPLANP